VTSEAPACGTPQGYRLHLNQGETPCVACRVANTAYSRQVRAETEERMRQRRERMSPWGVFKHGQILHALPIEERDEVERLERRKRLSAASQKRLAELVHRACDLHEQKRRWRAENPPDTSWFDEIKERMWASLTPGEAEYWRRVVEDRARRIDW
jgi:hypothetical protein